MKSFAILAAFCISACAAEPPTTTDQETATTEEAAAPLQSTPDTVESRSISDCVSIQWCNEPGGIGTVCSVTAACQGQCPLQAVQDECRRQAKLVCGTIIQPFDIVCHH